MPLKDIKILNQEVDIDSGEPSYYRILVDQKYFKYITIDPGTYDADDLCFPPALLEKLPDLPSGDWNTGRISQGTSEPAKPHFSAISKATLPSISPLWHPKSYDYLSLTMQQRLKPNVYAATSPEFNVPLIAKFARFDWEVAYYTAETQAYAWIHGHGIGPAFLGYLTEEGRVIGFLVERIEGRHATVSDIRACEIVVGRLHGLGVLHGDLNRHNFLVGDGGAVLVDFETAKLSGDSRAMAVEADGLKQQLLDESGGGGVSEDS